jgi:glycosyltransferase involved in cell wall biosynthesis
LKVTIGIPTYNQAAYIEKAVQSALSQTYPFIEVIVADDCSTDNTKDVLRKYSNDPRFLYSRNDFNLGRIGNYKNLLYNLASGDWYINADGDDYLKDNNFIALAVEMIKASKNVVAVVADCERYDEKKNTAIVYTSNYKDKEIVEGLDFLHSIAAQKAQTTHLTTLYNRQKAIEIDFYRLNILSSDFESIYRLLLHGNVVYLKRVVAVWRKHGENTVLTKSSSDSIKNFILPQSVTKYAQLQNINLYSWGNKVLKTMIAATLLESKKQNYVQLIKSLLHCLFRYPAATLKVIFNIKSVLKHI